MVLDTGAAANPARFAWLRSHNGLSKRAGYDVAVPYPTLARSKFGKWKAGNARHVADVPMFLGGRAGVAVAFSQKQPILAIMSKGALQTPEGHLGAMAWTLRRKSLSFVRLGRMLTCELTPSGSQKVGCGGLLPVNAPLPPGGENGRYHVSAYGQKSGATYPTGATVTNSSEAKCGRTAPNTFHACMAAMLTARLSRMEPMVD